MPRTGRSATADARATGEVARAGAAAPSASGSGSAGGGVRRDIQGLRAIAVALVLVYHLSDTVLPGGYVGVDVFFVISGFLITGQLLREATASGRVDLPRFWARRARRLLPAALLVLAVTLLTVWLVAPRGFLPDFLVQVAASAAYAQNWVLAAQSVDYMAGEAQVSPVQHYWSLSVEEQFYILWPLVAVAALAVAVRIARRRPAGPARIRGTAGPRGFAPVFALLVGGIAAASFAVSLVVTATDPSRAYFVTTTRAWEFAVGGLLACAAAAPSRPLERIGPRTRAALAWVGLAGIAVSAATYSDAVPFPGALALLPVLATALVIAAREPEAAWSPQPLLAARPMQWLGDVSYGAYLWHFPLIVLLPFAVGGRIGPLAAAGIIVATLALAWASKTFVEDPFRTGLSRSWANGRTLLVTSGAMVGVLVLALAGVSAADRAVDAERAQVQAEIAEPAPCLGATALEDDSGCDPVPEQEPIPEPSLADKAPERCLDDYGVSVPTVCTYGVPAAEAERTIALVGDSHAEQWLPPLRRAAEERHWRLIVMAKASCPFTTAERDFTTTPDAENAQLRAECAEWNAAALDEIARDPGIDTVVTSAKSTNRVVPADGESWRRTAVESYERRWAELPDTVSQVVVVKDTPQMADDVISCVTAEGERAGAACAVPKTEAFGDDPIADAAEAVRADAGDGAGDDGRGVSADVALLDLDDYFVVDDECPPVIGGVLAFRDSHHVSWAYAEMLAQPLGDELAAAIGA